MVQEYSSPVRVYEFSFEMVMKAYEKRFPTCKMIPAFLGSETMYDFESEDKSVHVVERKCKLAVDAPYLLKKMAGVDFFYCMQRNSLNRRDRTLKIEAWNDSFSSRLSVKEHCYYSVHPDNPQWTIFEQDASLDIISFFGFEQAVEKILIKAYTNNLKKGKEIIMYYINELLSEGVSYIAPFEGSDGRPRLKRRSTTEQDEAKQETTSLDSRSEQVCPTDASVAVGEHSVEPIERGKLKSENRKSGEFEKQREANRKSMERKEEEDDSSMNDSGTYQGTGTAMPPVAEYKLEDSYMRRYLGELSLQEESGLMQLRKRLSQLHSGKIPDEMVLLRFLRARECNVEKALDMLKNALHWRRTHHVDSIATKWNPPEDLLEYYPGGWHHFDKDGRPLYIIRFGSMDIKGLMKSVGEDGFVKHVVSINEEATKKCRDASIIFDRPINNWTCVCDMDGLSMRHLWRPGVRALLQIIEVVEANYPETMGRLLIVRAPKVFGVVWTLLYPFIDENTRKKFFIYTGDDYQGPGGLADYVPMEYLPDFLGGACACDVRVGKSVPKSFYRHSSFSEGSTCGESTMSWLASDVYHSASVMKASPHDVILTVSEAEAVITWDFDVIDGDCEFHVLRHKRPREFSSNNLTSCLGDTSTPKQAIRLGVDATVVEKPIHCARGESIQGSHICQQSGVYILQWKYANPVSSRHQSLRMLNKTKVHYYHEILPSRDFKGSLTSISSSTSGFSQLSMASLSSASVTRSISVHSANASCSSAFSATSPEKSSLKRYSTLALPGRACSPPIVARARSQLLLPLETPVETPVTPCSPPPTVTIEPRSPVQGDSRRDSLLGASMSLLQGCTIDETET